MNHDRDTETLDTDAPATDVPGEAGESDAPATEAEAPATDESPTATEAEAPAGEAAAAAEPSAEDAASPEAAAEEAGTEEESGPEASVDADDDSEAEAAPDGSSAEAAEDVSPEAAEAEVEEKAAEDDAGQGPEAESPAEDTGQGPEAAEAEAEEKAAEDDAGQEAEAGATTTPEAESSDPQAAIAESEDPEAAARAVFGLHDKDEEEELKPEEAAAILAPAEEEEEEPEVEEEVTLEDADLVDVYEEEPAEPSPYDRAGDWYVVHTYSGYEKKVKSNLETRVKSLHLEGRIHEVSIPMDDVIEFKGGKKTVVQRKVFPGYLLVRMTLDDETWGAVRNTPGVTGFVGGGAKPTPLSRKEVESILRVRPEDEAKKARPRLEFEVGDQVQVKTGPFADFNGLIDEINVDQSTLKVLVNIFGRETPVTLDFADVAKL